MPQYESIFIGDPTLTDDELEKLIKSYESLVSDAKGKILNLERWGRRRLAYPIGGREEGIYFLMLIECDASFPRELERRYRINDRILRHLTVRVENEAQLGPSPIMKARPPEREETPAPAPTQPPAPPAPSA